MLTPTTSLAMKKGEIQIIFGPMFSGKTTELMRRLKRYQIARHKCLVVKYANDVRYDGERLATHDNQTLAAVSAKALNGLCVDAMQYSIIGIDEGQFFPDTVQFAEAMANCGKVVIVAALDGTYLRQGFGDILSLVPLAESVIKLTAVCMRCYSDASYTKRTSNETDLEVIGGSDKYIAVCRECYHKESPVKSVTSPLKDCNQRTSSNQPSVEAKKLDFDTACTPDEDKENKISVAST